MTKQSKFVSPEEAVRAVRAGDWVDYGFGGGFPELLDRALAARRDELSEVKIRGGLVIRPRIEAVECDPEQKAFSYYSWHIGDYERKLQSRGLCRFLPMVLRYLPELYRSHIRVDTAFVPVSRPDGEGYCGLGISNYAWRTIFEQARTVIFEINEQLPTLQGVDGSHRVHLSEADFVVEGAHEPLPIRTYKDPSPIDVQIAEHVVREIPNGATLSLGVRGRALYRSQAAGPVRFDGPGVPHRHHQRRVSGAPPGGQADQPPEGGGRRPLHLESGHGQSRAVRLASGGAGPLPSRRRGLRPLPGAHGPNLQLYQHQRRRAAGPDG